MSLLCVWLSSSIVVNYETYWINQLFYYDAWGFNFPCYGNFGNVLVLVGLCIRRIQIHGLCGLRGSICVDMTRRDMGAGMGSVLDATLVISTKTTKQNRKFTYSCRCLGFPTSSALYYHGLIVVTQPRSSPFAIETYQSPRTWYTLCLPCLLV